MLPIDSAVRMVMGSRPSIRMALVHLGQRQQSTNVPD
jgi:hypothetical protein